MKNPTEINAMQINHWTYLIYSSEELQMVPGFPSDVFHKVQILDTDTKTVVDCTYAELLRIEADVCNTPYTSKSTKLYFWFLKKILSGTWKTIQEIQDEEN